jgi:signal transduction histidine kinase
MVGLGWGLLIGWLSSGVVFGSAGWLLYRRYERLQIRTREAERLAELGTLTGGLAHEIKNPLSTVQLNLQLLSEDIPPDDDAFSRLTSRLKTVQKETSRLRDILDDFLRYAGRMELQKKPVELNGMLEELVDFFTMQAQMQRVQLRLKRSDQPITAQIDERLLKQAVLNLLINALQAMPEHGGEIILAAGVDETGFATIDVIDTGTGMDEQSAKRIFDAYYSTKRSGTGLGLAICRRIVREHGGDISVSSTPGKGSDFKIRIPIDGAAPRL